MLLLGCKPAGRHTEQHDVFFGIAASLQELIPQIKNSWKDAGTIHIDAWREVRFVNGFEVSIIKTAEKKANKTELYFINLGGYLPGEFDERHYKILVAADSLELAKKQVKQNSFFKTHDFAHIDDKFSLDIDDIFSVNEILKNENQEYDIHLTATGDKEEDAIHLGYFQLHKLKEEW